MSSKLLNKWENYVAEIRPEIFEKLNEYKAIDNLGNNKKNKAFRLSKNGIETTNLKKVEEINANNINQRFQENMGIDIGLAPNNDNNNNNVIRINPIARENNVEEGENDNIDFE
jgi:hypothetical protein